MNSGGHTHTIPATINPPYPETETTVTPTHPIEQVTVTDELPVPKSPDVFSSVNYDCHDDGSTDCDLFPGVTAFRRRFISNFIFAHLNINSYRHKYISIHDILAHYQGNLLRPWPQKLTVLVGQCWHLDPHSPVLIKISADKRPLNQLTVKNLFFSLIIKTFCH